MRASLNLETLVTVFGGSGFLGRHVVEALARRQYRIRVAVRRPDLAGHLQPLGETGQIYAVQANVRHRGSVAAAVRDSAAVVNLVGIGFERWRQRFHIVNELGAEAVALAAAGEGAEIVHVSALGADRASPSAYARSKALGEGAVLSATPHATIVRPAPMFGPDDRFLNRLGALARLSAALPLIGGGVARMQPVFAGDVAEAIAQAVDGRAEGGTIYELGGPEILTMREIVERVLAMVERRRLLVPVPHGLAKLAAGVLQLLPQPSLTPDQVEMLKRDLVVSAAALQEERTLAALGVEELHSILAIAPAYLLRYRKSGQFGRWRPARS